jgi:hypothetical protein
MDPDFDKPLQFSSLDRMSLKSQSLAVVVRLQWQD